PISGFGICWRKVDRIFLAPQDALKSSESNFIIFAFLNLALLFAPYSNRHPVCGAESSPSACAGRSDSGPRNPLATRASPSLGSVPKRPPERGDTARLEKRS